FNLAAELERGRVTRLHLTGLDAPALGTLLRARLDRRLSPAEIAYVHRVSEGNPLYAIEIARAIVARPAPPGTHGPPPLPDAVGDPVVQRIRALPLEARRPVLFAAALARPTISRMTTLLGEGAMQGVRLALDSGVLTAHGHSLSFTHPLLASAAYSDARPDELREAHLAVADGVEELEESALHLALGTTGPNEAVAAALDEASRVAFRRGASDASADLSTLARDLTPPRDPLARHRRAIEAANAHFSAGNTPRAGQLL